MHLQTMVDSFVEAAVNGNVAHVDQYVRSGIPIDAEHSVLGYNALHGATALKDGRVLRSLIRGGADVEHVAKVRAPERLSVTHERAR